MEIEKKKFCNKDWTLANFIYENYRNEILKDWTAIFKERRERKEKTILAYLRHNKDATYMHMKEVRKYTRPFIDKFHDYYEIALKQKEMTPEDTSIANIFSLVKRSIVYFLEHPNDIKGFDKLEKKKNLLLQNSIIKLKANVSRGKQLASTLRRSLENF